MHARGTVPVLLWGLRAAVAAVAPQQPAACPLQISDPPPLLRRPQRAARTQLPWPPRRRNALRQCLHSLPPRPHCRVPVSAEGLGARCCPVRAVRPGIPYAAQVVDRVAPGKAHLLFLTQSSYPGAGGEGEQKEEVRACCCCPAVSAVPSLPRSCHLHPLEQSHRLAMCLYFPPQLCNVVFQCFHFCVDCGYISKQAVVAILSCCKCCRQLVHICNAWVHDPSARACRGMLSRRQHTVQLDQQAHAHVHNDGTKARYWIGTREWDDMWWSKSLGCAPVASCTRANASLNRRSFSLPTLCASALLMPAAHVPGVSFLRVTLPAC